MPLTTDMCKCGHEYALHIDPDTMCEGECSKGWDYCKCDSFKQVIKDKSNKPS